MSDQAQMTGVGHGAAHNLALHVIRTALQDNQEWTEHLHDQWLETKIRFRLAQKQMLEHQHVGIITAAENDAPPTRHEKRLLRATAAAQVDDIDLIDNLIFTLAPGRQVRQFLTKAVTTLAAELIIVRCQLDTPAMPAAALTVARLHDRNLSDVTVR